MASAITLTGDWLVSFGNKYQTSGTGNLGTYATNGIAVSATQVGLGVIESLVIDPAAGYVFEWVASTGKVKAYRSAGFTPAGTVAAPVFTGSALSNHAHDLKLITGGAGDGAVSIETTSGPILRIETIGADQTVAGADSATKGGVITASAGTPAGTNSAPAFTGTAVAAAAMVEVANAVDLAAITFRFRAIGY